MGLFDDMLEAAPAPAEAPPKQTGGLFDDLLEGVAPATQPRGYGAKDVAGRSKYDVWLEQVDDAQTMQESGGRQYDSKGRVLRSPKGAEGIKQIMPSTGPEAASLAGEKWDRRRLAEDPEYNRRLGNAYQKNLFKKYDNLELGLAAYNFGMGNIDNLLKEKGDPRLGQISWSEFSSHLPNETRDYVTNILAKRKRPQMDPDVPMPELAQEEPGFSRPQAPPTVGDQVIGGLEEANRVADTGVKGAVSFITDPLVYGTGQLADMALGAVSPELQGQNRELMQALGESPVGQTYQAMTQPKETPRTTPGRIASDALSASLLALTPAGAMAKSAQTMGAPLLQRAGFQAANRLAQEGLAGAAGGTAAAELAGQLSGQNPVARAVGGIVGGMPFGTPSLATGGPRARMAEQTIQGVSDYELSFAKNMQRMAKERYGVNLTLDQALPSESNARNIERALASSSAGSDLGRVFREQLAQIDELGKTAQRQMPGTVRQSGEMGNMLQNTLTQVTKTYQKFLDSQTEPYFKQSGRIPQDVMQGIYDDLDNAMQSIGPTTDSAGALRRLQRKLKVGTTEVLGEGPRPKRINVYEDRPEVINRLLNESKDRAGQVVLGGPSSSNTVSRAIGGPAADIKETLKEASPGFKKGMEEQSRLRRKLIEPLTSGPIGRIVNSVGTSRGQPSSPDMFYKILDEGTAVDPKTGKATHSTIMELRDRMARGAGEEGRTVFNDGVATWLAGKVDAAFETEGGRQAAQAGGKLYQNLFGTANSKQGTRDALKAVGRNQGLRGADLDAYVKGFEDTVDVMGRMARRPEPEYRIGSSAADLKKASDVPGLTIASKWTWVQPLRQPVVKVDMYFRAKNYKWLAENLSSAEGVEAIQKIGRARGNRNLQGQLVNTFLIGGSTAKTSEE